MARATARCSGVRRLAAALLQASLLAGIAPQAEMTASKLAGTKRQQAATLQRASLLAGIAPQAEMTASKLAEGQSGA